MGFFNIDSAFFAWNRHNAVIARLDFVKSWQSILLKLLDSIELLKSFLYSAFSKIFVLIMLTLYFSAILRLYGLLRLFAKPRKDDKKAILRLFKILAIPQQNFSYCANIITKHYDKIP